MLGFGRILSVSVVCIGIAACSGHSATAPSNGTSAARTALPRALSPAERDVLGAASAFSFDLFRTINADQTGDNVFVSPLSASFALGMALNGAAGQTFDETRSALRFDTASLGAIDSGYKSLIGLLTSLDASTTMQITNAIFYRSGFPFNQTFLTGAASYFDADVTAQNFDDVPGTLAAVNGWVNAKTNGRIPSMLDTVHSDDVMYLLNAMYFKGSWRERFDSNKTIDAPFHSVGGDQSARLMHRTQYMAYAETDKFQAVDLAYGDSSFTMTVLLPKLGADVQSVALSLSPESWNQLAASFHSQYVDLYLPRVTLAWKRALIPDLQALGMHAAFTSAADFTPMSPRGHELEISTVRQNTFVAIDEEGTEAAAVTIGGVVVTAVPVATVMRVDSPYVFVIRERLSGTVLFMGKIVHLP